MAVTDPSWTPMSDDEAAALRGAPWTYAEVGATADESLPEDYHHLRCAGVLGSGRAVFDQAAVAIRDWQVQRRSGLAVTADGPVRPNAVAVVRIGPRPLSLAAPVRVVYVVEEADRVGFGYGTLPGHPERGEESFVVAIDSDETVRLVITAFSRPATWWAALGGPVTAAVQRRVTRRYLRALTPASAPGSR